MSDLARSSAPCLSDVWVQMHGPIDHKIAVCVFLPLAACMVVHLGWPFISAPPRSSSPSISPFLLHVPCVTRKQQFWNQLSTSVEDWLDLHTELLLLLCECGSVSSGAENARRTFLIPLLLRAIQKDRITFRKCSYGLKYNMKLWLKSSLDRLWVFY